MALGMIFLSKDDFANYFSKTLVTSVSISSLFAVIGYFFKVEAFSFISAEETEVRGTGGSMDANNLCLMVIFGMPIAVHWLVNSRGIWERISTFVMLILHVIAVMATFSRGGAMIFAITVLLLLIVHAKRLKLTQWGFVIFISAATIFAVLFFTPSDYWDRLRSVSDTTDRAIGRRQSYITVASGAVKKHPIIGSGTGTFRDIFATTDYAA
ncbi:MAG: O-antigen ligase family protein [Planctomycetes bacterium]|nr:O-antigen ligase family protein [Planctomycetota bacterium]